MVHVGATFLLWDVGSLTAPYSLFSSPFGHVELCQEFPDTVD
jgi:hypothetical protein